MGVLFINFEKKLMLFLSADMIDSTALKYEKRYEWSTIMQKFYNDFSTDYLENSYKDKGIDKPTLWKILGDELVFTVQLKEQSDAAKHLIIFRDALYTYNTISSTQNSEIKIRIKGTAWIAGFPVRNIEPIEDDSVNKRTSLKNPTRLELIEFGMKIAQRKDYIGPSIDLGFRLSKKSSERKLIISVDLAFLLLKGEPVMDLHYFGKSKFKGVLENKAYPILWIDIFNGKPCGKIDIFEKLAVKACHTKDLLEACREFIDKNKDYIDLPFITGDNPWGDKPEGYDEKYDERIKQANKVWIDSIKKDIKEMPKFSIDLKELSDSDVFTRFSPIFESFTKYSPANIQNIHKVIEAQIITLSNNFNTLEKNYNEPITTITDAFYKYTKDLRTCAEYNELIIAIVMLQDCKKHIKDMSTLFQSWSEGIEAFKKPPENLSEQTRFESFINAKAQEFNEFHNHLLDARKIMFNILQGYGEK